jgi:hypothetical protein
MHDQKLNGRPHMEGGAEGRPRITRLCQTWSDRKRPTPLSNQGFTVLEAFEFERGQPAGCGRTTFLLITSTILTLFPCCHLTIRWKPFLLNTIA